MKTEAQIKAKLKECKKWLVRGLEKSSWSLVDSEARKIKLLKWVLDKPKPEAKENV